MPLTDKLTVVTQAIYDKLNGEKATLVPGGVADVFYGDQEMIPRSPALAVESGPYNRALTGLGGKGRTDNIFRVYVMGYVGKVGDVQVTRKDTDTLGEAVMASLHQDVTLGGLVIHGFVTEITPGYASRSGKLMRATRILWEGKSKTLI